MLSTPLDDTGTPETAGPVPMAGGNSYAFIFSPTARTAGYLTDDGERVDVPSPSVRRKTKCYVRGYSETAEIITDDAAPWMWRRIVFSTIG